MRLTLPGGAGYGDPCTREVSQVAEDVADDLVSVETAREQYGVVFGADGKVDESATRKRRA